MRRIIGLAFAELECSLIRGLMRRAVAVVERRSPGRTRAGEPYMREDLAV